MKPFLMIFLQEFTFLSQRSLNIFPRLEFTVSASNCFRRWLRKVFQYSAMTFMDFGLTSEHSTIFSQPICWRLKEKLRACNKPLRAEATEATEANIATLHAFFLGQDLHHHFF